MDGQAPPRTSSRPYPEVGILHSELRTLPSVVSDQEYQIAVFLPESYADSGRAYPVLYLLDSNMLFGATVNLHLPLTWGPDAALPELLIVGIGYKIKKYDDWLQRRTQNLFPGAAQFLEFIRAELIPFVDANYRTNPAERSLYGHSGGGWFNWYTLFHHPELFTRYCAGSPGMGPEVIEWERVYAGQHGDLPARLAIVIGEKETDQAPKVREFCETLKDRNYAGLDMTLLVLEGEDHGTVIGRQIALGLPTVFAGFSSNK